MVDTEYETIDTDVATAVAVVTAVDDMEVVDVDAVVVSFDVSSVFKT